MKDIKPNPNREVFLKIMRSMTPEQKLIQMFNLNELTQNLKLTGLRMQHPELNDQQINELYIKLRTRCYNKNY